MPAVSAERPNTWALFDRGAYAIQLAHVGVYTAIAEGRLLKEEKSYFDFGITPENGLSATCSATDRDVTFGCFREIASRSGQAA
jgi:hypothetical protein